MEPRPFNGLTGAEIEKQQQELSGERRTITGQLNKLAQERKRLGEELANIQRENEQLAKQLHAVKGLNKAPVVRMLTYKETRERCNTLADTYDAKYKEEQGFANEQRTLRLRLKEIDRLLDAAPGAVAEACQVVRRWPVGRGPSAA